MRGDVSNWAYIADTASILEGRKGASQTNDMHVHVSSVIPTPEVIAQLCAEHGRNAGILNEGGLAAVACFECFGTGDEGRLAEGGEGKVLGGLYDQREYS